MLLRGAAWRIPVRSWLGSAELLPAEGFPVPPAIGAGAVTSCRSGFLFPAHEPELWENSSPIPLRRWGIPPSAISSTRAELPHKTTQPLSKEIQGDLCLCARARGKVAVPAEH